MITPRIPEFGEVRKSWYVLGKAHARYGGDNIDPRSFCLTVIWVLRDADSETHPGWLPEDFAQKVPSEYHAANKFLLQPGYGGCNTEQEAWSNYMRHVEHEMCVVRDGANAQLTRMKKLSDLARRGWIKAQEVTPLKGLIPPEVHEREIKVK